ncbi:DUF3892 domain-containing protein [Aeromicrobium sp. 179-A 4D2 NHS]|uniref:DUF3892 domain-containing protein n=1 Tax=Aeromicrobium sp. 179-A 4D2 NHS TaxID=3142375 RepID=UPI00399EEB36
MITKQITKVRRDSDGDITDVFASSARHKDWESISYAIRAIELRLATYFVVEDGTRAEVYALPRENPRYLTTSPDGTTSNNLDCLPSA